jgi:hypothetical protein
MKKEREERCRRKAKISADSKIRGKKSMRGGMGKEKAE